MTNSLKPQRDFSCKDCGVDQTYECPMIDDDVWLKVAPKDIVLCTSCFQGRLGRPLKTSDLRPCPMTDMWVLKAAIAGFPFKGYVPSGRLNSTLSATAIGARIITHDINHLLKGLGTDYRVKVVDVLKPVVDKLGPPETEEEARIRFKVLASVFGINVDVANAVAEQ